MPGKGNVDLSRDPFGTRSLELGGDPGYQGGGSATRLGARDTTASLYAKGVALPFVIFALLSGLFTFTYHLVPLVPWMVAFLALDIAIFGCWPQASPMGRTRWDWAPMIVCLLAVFFGVTSGLELYNQISPMVHIRFLHSYSGVRPGANPDAYMDAGVLGFSRDSRLDASQSAGFFSWPYRYCAAPIVSSNVKEPVSFWAAGVNCCDARGKFWCADASDTDSHGGAGKSTAKMMGIRIVPSLNVGRWIWHGHDSSELYRKAVGMAAGGYGLEVPREPIIVQWTKDIDADEWIAMIAAFLGFGVSLVIALVVLCVFGRSLVNAKDGGRR